MRCQNAISGQMLNKNIAIEEVNQEAGSSTCNNSSSTKGGVEERNLPYFVEHPADEFENIVDQNEQRSKFVNVVLAAGVKSK